MNEPAANGLSFDMGSRFDPGRPTKLASLGN
jgi:hypothetical protein